MCFTNCLAVQERVGGINMKKVSCKIEGDCAPSVAWKALSDDHAISTRHAEYMQGKVYRKDIIRQ